MAQYLNNDGTGALTKIVVRFFIDEDHGATEVYTAVALKRAVNKWRVSAIFHEGVMAL